MEPPHHAKDTLEVSAGKSFKANGRTGTLCTIGMKSVRISCSQLEGILKPHGRLKPRGLRTVQGEWDTGDHFLQGTIFYRGPFFTHYRGPFFTHYRGPFFTHYNTLVLSFYPSSLPLSFVLL